MMFIMATQVAFAAFSFSGFSDEANKNSKYSLKNLSHYTHRNFSLSLIKSTLIYKGTQIVSETFEDANTLELRSMMQYNNGNTTYVMPYKFKIRVPKFKTPTPPAN